MILVQGAAREHIPIDPANKKSLEAARVASQSGPKAVPDPEHRPSIEAITVEMQMEEWYAGQMRYTKVFEAREAHIGIATCQTNIFIWLTTNTATLNAPLSDNISQALRDSRKISSFYSHQVAAINALDQGKHVIVSTSTASGKSIIYQVPVLLVLLLRMSNLCCFRYHFSKAWSKTKVLRRSSYIPPRFVQWKNPDKL